MPAGREKAICPVLRDVYLLSESIHAKRESTKAQFGFKLNWAFVT